MPASKWKPYPEYKSCKVGWIDRIPSEWVVKKLGRSFSSIGSGTTPNSSNENNYMNGTIPWVNTGELRENWIFDTEKKITEKAFNENSALKMYPEGSLLVAMYGATIGRLGWLGTPSTVNQAVCCFSEPIDVNAEFVYYWLMVNKKDYIGFYSSGGGQPNVNQEKLCNLRISMPDISTQGEIVKLCKNIDEKTSISIDNLHDTISLIEEIRSSLITQAVTKGLNPDVPMKETGLDWYPEVPSHWKLRRVKHIATISPSNVDKKKYDGQEEVRLANYVDVYYNDRITEKLDLMVATASDNEIAKFSLKAGDLIITKDSETWDDIAVPAFVPKTMEGVVCGYHLTLIRPNQEHILGEFLFRTYQTIGVQDQYYYNANGVTRYGLGSYWVDNGIVPVPPLKEQREIAEYIDNKLTLMEMIREKTASKIEKLKEYQTALISAGVTGKIDIRESD